VKSEETIASSGPSDLKIDSHRFLRSIKILDNFLCVCLCIKQILLDSKAQIDYNMTIVGRFNTPFLPADSFPIYVKPSELNNTIDQMDLTDIYRIFHPAATQYTFFSTDHGTFSKTDHISGHKAILNR
jgi:hypothetical protein